MKKDTDNIRITPRWSKTKEQIWNEKFEALIDTPTRKAVPFYKRSFFAYAAAIVAIIALAIPTVAYNYTTEVVANCGEHRSVELPDGSQVELNADSRLSYKPFWWTIARNVKLSGEAYFEVEKGSRFDVQSPTATVSVLGTSFNIFDRGNNYNVTCLTGKVRVANESQAVTLTPNSRVSYSKGQLSASDINNSQQIIGWTQNRFSFDSVPLSEVIAEVERQYKIKIAKPTNNNYLYTGSFSKENTPDEVLKIIGKPFNLKLKIVE